MAGLFGLFNYSKEGPGVDKNAPKKRSFFVFFEIYWRKFWKLFQANVLFLLVNLPLVTRGLADVGLCKITRNFAREKHAFVREDFFETIRNNWRQALPVGIINLLVTTLLTFNISYYFIGMFPTVWGIFGADVTGAQPMMLGILDYIVMGMTTLCFTLFTWMKYYIPMMVMTFRLSLKDIYKNAFMFAIVGLKRNLLISAVLILLYLLVAVVFFTAGWAVGILWLFVVALFLPAFRSLLIQFTIFPLIKKHMIDPYYAQNPQADKQLRRDLNLEVEETAEEKAAVVFDDTRRVEKEEATLPRQYSQEELRRLSRASDDDDDTI